AGEYQFIANGSAIRFPGFMSLYQAVDEESKDEKEMLPSLSKALILSVEKLEPKQHFTLPPPRFSEASLVKELEENGIGRPSTYAAILSTIRDKGYVELIKGYFHPSELGFIVNDLVVGSFSDLVNVDFTARMEDHLDQIETAEMNYMKMLSEFFRDFQKQLEKASQGMLNLKGVGLPTSLPCPKCGAKLHVKVGKNGHFLACEGYPLCNYTSNYLRDEKGKIAPVDPAPVTASTEVCDKCGRTMIVKQGKFGVFLACSGYPGCKNTRSINSNGPDKETGVHCPSPGCDGQIVKKVSKRGKVFYGCNRYPKCTFALWERPVDIKCPECGADFLVEKVTKRDGAFISCLTAGCTYKEKINS
ncbi:MAG: topoisomerase DNA-binding C4 zinc finger domain-containing protein, partial [Thermodesulfobacteriota bacterium]